MFHVSRAPISRCEFCLFLIVVAGVTVVAFLAFAVIGDPRSLAGESFCSISSLQFKEFVKLGGWLACLLFNPCLWKLSARSLMRVLGVIIGFRSA